MMFLGKRRRGGLNKACFVLAPPPWLKEGLYNKAAYQPSHPPGELLSYSTHHPPPIAPASKLRGGREGRCRGGAAVLQSDRQETQRYCSLLPRKPVETQQHGGLKLCPVERKQRPNPAVLLRLCESLCSKLSTQCSEC